MSDYKVQLGQVTKKLKKLGLTYKIGEVRMTGHKYCLFIYKEEELVQVNFLENYRDFINSVDTFISEKGEYYVKRN